MSLKVTNFWLLTMEFPPFFGGGIGTYCKHWTEILVKKGVNVTVFLADPHVTKEIIEEKNNVRIIRFSPFENNDSIPLGYNTLVSFAYAQILKKYLENEGIPDVLESQEYNGIAYYTLQYKHLNYLLFKDLYIQIVCHAPSFLYLPINKVPKYQLPYYWIMEMERFCITAADILISPSLYIIEKIKESIDLKDKQIKILPYPYSLPNMCIEKKPSKPTAIFYGKLSPSKGIFELLTYFILLWNKGIKIQLILVGDENYFYHPEMITCGKLIRTKYKKQILENKLIIAGSIAPEKLMQTLNEVKFVIIPSLIDNFPFTVLECMSMGKIVLASIQGGQSEIIISGSNGFLFDHTDAITFMTQVENILNLDERSIKKIEDEAIATVLKVCDAENYFLKRMEIQNNHNYSELNIFPFSRLINDKETGDYLAINNNDDLLSVVIPYYNLGKFITETIESIYKSDYKKIEVLIINDGSTDQYSIDILNHLQNKYPSLIIINTKNNGLSEARNTGAKKATGEYLAFLDADDMVDNRYYSKAINLLKIKINVHFVGCWTQYFGKSTDSWPTFNPEPPFLLIHNMINSSALVYRKNSFLSAGLNDPNLLFGLEDYDSVISMIKHGLRGVVLPELLFHYRVRNNSMARNFNKNKVLYLLQIISEKHQKFYATFAVETTNLLNSNGPGYKYDNPSLDYHRFDTFSNKQKLLQKLILKINKRPVLKQVVLKIYKYLKN